MSFGVDGVVREVHEIPVDGAGLVLHAEWCEAHHVVIEFDRAA